MSKNTNRAALALLGAFGAAIAFAAPASAEDPPFEQACGKFASPNCVAERQPANSGMATVPGIRPLQPVPPVASATPVDRTRPPRGGAGS